jgi:hypothetical protein
MLIHRSASRGGIRLDTEETAGPTLSRLAGLGVTTEAAFARPLVPSLDRRRFVWVAHPVFGDRAGSG